MRAICWWGTNEVREVRVPDPKLITPRDAIVRVTLSAICGSDLHLYHGYIPAMREGDILGHEFMGIVEEVGSEVKKLRPGDRVVVPFTISCGGCYHCAREQWALCDNSNPNLLAAEKVYGFSGAGMFGFSHLFGGYAGGQAQYVRVPFADVGPLKVENDLPDEKLLLLSDVLPTGYMAAENACVRPGDTVAIWGCGPVGLFAIQSAYLMGSERVIAIDNVASRLELARERCGAEVLNFNDVNVVEVLKETTGGRGPDSCIDAVGMEAHGKGLANAYDKVKQTARLESDRPHVLRQTIKACRKGGSISIPGVYSGLIDKVPMGAAFSKGLTFRMGQTHMPRYMHPLLRKIETGVIDPTFVITHRLKLGQAPQAYAALGARRENYVKVVLDPN